MKRERNLDVFNRLVQIETDECVIWPRGRITAGYGCFTIGDRQVYAHSEALIRRVGPRPPHMEAAHGPCHNPACMNYRHLRWATSAENSADMWRDGTVMLGTAASTSKLTEADVREIRRLRAAGTSMYSMAKRFNISESGVKAIVDGRNWAWLP